MTRIVRCAADVAELLAERDALAERAEKAEAEAEALKHDIERTYASLQGEANARIDAENRAEKLHTALEALAYTVGLIVDHWNDNHPDCPHPETRRIAAAREALAAPREAQ